MQTSNTLSTTEEWDFDLLTHMPQQNITVSMPPPPSMPTQATPAGAMTFSDHFGDKLDEEDDFDPFAHIPLNSFVFTAGPLPVFPHQSLHTVVPNTQFAPHYLHGTATYPGMVAVSQVPAAIAPQPSQNAAITLPTYVRPPRHHTITAEEILIFNEGRYLIIPEAAVRFMRNGIDMQQATRYRLTTLGQQNSAQDNRSLAYKTTRDRIKHQYIQGGKASYNRVAPGNNSWSVGLAHNSGPQNDLTSNGWQFRDQHANRNGYRIDGKPAIAMKEKWEDVPLSALYQGVRRNNFPAGQGRGIMTQCLEAVHDDPAIAAMNLTTTNWSFLIQHLGLVGDPGPQPRDPAKNVDEEFAESF